MVRRITAPKTVQRFQDLIGFGLSMQEEIDRLKELVDSGEYTKMQLSPVYMMTRHWRYMRKCALRRDKFQCQECGTNDVVLHVHHKKYAEYGEEDLEDLQTLCVDCHDEVSSFDLRDKPDNPVHAGGQLFAVMDRAKRKKKEKWSWY